MPTNLLFVMPKRSGFQTGVVDTNSPAVNSVDTDLTNTMITYTPDLLGQGPFVRGCEVDHLLSPLVPYLAVRSKVVRYSLLEVNSYTDQRASKPLYGTPVE